VKASCSTSGWPGREPPTLASFWTGKLPARSHASRPTPSPTLPAAVPPPWAASAPFQPVVDGGGRLWSLECHNCDKFVLSGADLLYWQRKREQWRQLTEGGPDGTTADYLHRYFEPIARAIDGLEQALAGLGLLGEALALDCANPRTTSTVSGPPSAPPTSPTPAATKPTAKPTTVSRMKPQRCLGMNTATDPEHRTAAALAAHRRNTQAAIQRVRDAITLLRHEKTQVSVAAVARHAGSRTFLCDNPENTGLVAAAIAKADERHRQILTEQDAERDATWRERALKRGGRSQSSQRPRVVAEFLHLFRERTVNYPQWTVLSRETTQTGDASDETPTSRTCSLRVIAGQTQSSGLSGR
jgi:hypothetical protein